MGCGKRAKTLIIGQSVAATARDNNGKPDAGPTEYGNPGIPNNPALPNQQLLPQPLLIGRSELARDARAIDATPPTRCARCSLLGGIHDCRR
jgi:hypothetical protein